MKFSIEAQPTFKAKVDIPLHGGGVQPVEFTFKHRTRKAMDVFVEELKALTDDADGVMTMAEGWELTDPFTKESITTLLENYEGSAGAIASAYFREIRQARTGN